METASEWKQRDDGNRAQWVNNSFDGRLENNGKFAGNIAHFQNLE